MIMSLPNKWDEMVGEEETLLSQGQKQLIPLTRAILANHYIHIMNEATSSIDTLTEKNIHYYELYTNQFRKERTEAIGLLNYLYE